ncbi:TetR/AcrR family transcriptional regulator C-terminal domain-containing protein [Streptomyces sp. NPDC006733]|uniref:TetR/AcrR family transcriptional regulator n=1 Tax=Streptomyces sp. NPDC006733 TaxID=3155460 RepID=UPI0034114629
MPSSASPSGPADSGRGAVSARAPEVIWLRPERAGRGPRPAHSRAAIAAAAIEIADAGGLDAVSMRRVAAALGAGTMSLYNYVPKKEHLFDLMLDAVVGEFVLPDEPGGDPRADLTLLGHQMRAAMRRHHWVSGLLVSRPSLGPNALRCMEYFLGAMEPTGLDGPAMMEAFTLLNGFVSQFAEWEHATARAGGGEGASGAQWHTEVAAYLQGVALSGRYPRLTRALAGSGPPPDADTVFERSLGRLLTVLTQPPA